MTTTEAGERVVVILDGSRELNPSVMKWPLVGLSLKSGDKLFMVGILHQVINPMGFRTKLESGSIFGPSKKIAVQQMGKKLEEYKKNAEIVRISKQCGKEQIQFRIEMFAGYPLKEVAARFVKKIGATWLVLDRHMKNDQSYFVENLSCNIVRLKEDGNAVKLRGPNVRDNLRLPAARRSSVEMIPADGQSPRKHGGEGISKSVSPSSSASTSSIAGNRTSVSCGNEHKSSSLHVHDEEHGTTTGPENGGEHSPVSINESRDQKDRHTDENSKQHDQNDDWMGENPGDKVFKNSLCSICKNRRPRIGWMRDFSCAEIAAATDRFNDKNFLSEGGFGSVYRGEFNGLKIAVKQHKYNASLQGEKEFKSEVNILRTARHEHLVMLVGSCSGGNQRLLVYEHVCNGSLDLHLSRHSERPLSWENRVKIALGTARGLQYLHENNIIHRDVRPDNILVTHDFEPLLGDFGLARTQHEDSDKSSETLSVVGTLGYLAPEYAECGKVSTKTDVYSFGVVLLLLITGMKTTDERLGGKSLVGWARPLLKDRNYPYLIDPRILDSHDVHQLFWMVRVAEKCLTKDPQKRLSMDKVVFALSYITDRESTYSNKGSSPAQSDIVSKGSCDSQSLSQSQSQSPDDEDSVFTIETAPASNPSHFNARFPPSPPIWKTSNASAFYAKYASSRGLDQESYPR
ncbi:hypothetical protein like AT1G55200 [Hibiscus trionum]|uniref:Protein kinase domain-containing protein n=1 Tax=Hibiscus trionum TaxID=183268 RepID=A0A9W7HN95_HIBTR|nr:hypothetical protein like AT1G55200 [Hibiscus trionum]